MCGPNSALGLAEAERHLWPLVRDRLRQPGRLMGLMRGVLGGDAEVAVVVATSPTGVVRPVAVLVTPPIAAEIDLPASTPDTDIVAGSIAGDDVSVLLSQGAPAALLVTPWIREHLYLYSRELWHRPHAGRGDP